MKILLSQKAADLANEILYDQNGRSDLSFDVYYIGSVITASNILAKLSESNLVEGVDYKRPELKLYWMPNPPCKGFEFSVKNLSEAKDGYNILSYLDLDGEETKANAYGTEIFRQRLINAYKAYRRGRGINGAWLIECNVGGLLYKTVDGEWEEFVDEFGDQLNEIIQNDDN